MRANFLPSCPPSLGALTLPPFRFPVEQTALASGKILTWTKGFSATNAIGHDVVKLLQDALDRKHIHVLVSALVNDTVGTMLSASYQHGPAIVGAIFGTGTNGAYLEQVAKLTKLGDAFIADQQKRIGPYMVVNTEWGALDNGRAVLPITLFDAKLDRESINPCVSLGVPFPSDAYPREGRGEGGGAGAGKEGACERRRPSRTRVIGALICDHPVRPDTHPFSPPTKRHSLPNFSSRSDPSLSNPKSHKQAFEKLISGMYLGEILRNMLVHFIDCDLLFGGWSTPTLNKHYAVDTSFLSFVEAAIDTPEPSSSSTTTTPSSAAAAPSSSSSPSSSSAPAPSAAKGRLSAANQAVKDLIVRDLGVAAEGISEADLELVKWAVQAVGGRAAQMSACAIACIVEHTADDEGADPEAILDVGIDGSCVLVFSALLGLLSFSPTPGFSSSPLPSHLLFYLSSSPFLPLSCVCLSVTPD